MQSGQCWSAGLSSDAWVAAIHRLSLVSGHGRVRKGHGSSPKVDCGGHQPTSFTGRSGTKAKRFHESRWKFECAPGTSCSQHTL